MNKWTKTAGLIFMAAASVYADRAIAAKPGKPAVSPDKAGATDVKLLEETDPFATVAPTAATTPTATSAPAATATAPAADITGTVPVSSDTTKAGTAPVLFNADGTFSLNITAGADIVEQLRVLGFQAQMSIIPSKEVHGALPAMDLYNVTVHEALDALLHANGYAWREKGKFIYVYSAKEIQEQEKANRLANTEVFRLYYTPAANAITMIKPVLSADAQVASTTNAKSGIATGTTDVGGNEHAGEDVLVVTDYPEHLEKVRQVLKEIDRRPQQILIEATILRATLNEDNALGVDFNVVGGVDFSTIMTNSGGQFTGATPGSGSLTNFSTPAHSAGTGNNFTNQIANGLKVGLVTNNVSVFISALEGVTDTTILANPKVLALNKHKGEVIVGREDGYITTTFTETQSTQTVEFLKTGTRLIFRPYIGDDGYIRMEIHPEDSSGGLQTAQNLPFKITTEVTSNVMVKDGRTIVIGGLFREASDSTRSQIPGLGNLPLAGPLFRQTRDSTKREEVIILLTPHIVKDTDAYADVSEEALRDAEKLRTGVRKGMMWWGRERLAEMYYECAVAEMSKPRPDRKKALWNLDAATNLNPKFLEAIKMKQELTGKEITTSDGSTVRTFVKRAILADRVPATQPTAEATGVESPATQPAAVATTEEPASIEEETSEQAATLVEVAFGGEPTTAPTSQPATVVAAAPTTAPTTVAEEEDAPETAVTELPMEEVLGADEPEGNNK